MLWKKQKDLIYLDRMPENYIIQQPFNFHLDNLKQVHILKKKCDDALIEKDLLTYSNSLDAFLTSCYQFLDDKQIKDSIAPIMEKIKDNPIKMEDDFIIYDSELWFALRDLHKTLIIFLKINGISFLNYNQKSGIDKQREKHGLKK